MRDFEQHRRARVTGGRRSRLIGVSVLGGALLLVLMIVLGSVDPPPTPPAAAVPSVAPTGTPAISAAERLYLVGQITSNDGYQATYQTVIRAYDTGKTTSVGTLPGGQNQEFSPDGTRLFSVQSTFLQAIDVASGEEAWHAMLTTPLTPTRLFQSTDFLAVAPAGDIVAVYRPGESLNNPAGLIERFYARTGDALPPLRVDDAPRMATIFIGAGGTFFVATHNKVTAIDPASGAQHIIIEKPGDSAINVVMDPAGQTLFILNKSELLKVATAPDAPVRRLPLDLDVATVGFSSLAIAPSGDRLAVYGYVPGELEITSGQLGRGQTRSKLIVVNPQDGTILLQRVLTSYLYADSLTFNSTGTVLYYVEQSGISAWDLTNDQQIHAITNYDEDPFWSQGLIRAPLVPIQPGTLAARSLSQLPPPPTEIPRPSPTPQVQADPAPFAWILDYNDSNLDVVEYATDGSREVIASHVLASVDRPGLPPLLITSPESTSWALVDPLDDRTTPISMEVFLGRNQINPRRLALSPDGAQLALITERDPIAGDDLADARQVALIDVRSGQVRPLAATPGQGSIYPQVYWGNDGLYLVENRTAGIGFIPSRLLRLDPAAERPEFEELMAFGENGAYISLNAQAGLLVYEPYPEEIESSTLFVRNLRTGDESIIYAGTFIDADGFMISPDGAAVAYLAPLSGPEGGFNDGAALHIYSMASGTTIRSVEGQRGFQPNWLRWMADSSAVVFRSYQYSQNTGESSLVERRIAPDGRVISERSIQFPFSYSFNNSQRWSADERRLVELTDQERYGLLQLIDQSGRVLAALPLDLEIVRNQAITEPNTPVQQIVYVFGDE